jgi:tetratricopeptide (TPR) repeat protein
MVKMIWPLNLAVFYPYPKLLPAWQIAGAGILLLTISILVVRYSRARPYLLVGWFWYLTTLLPVIGLVQVGKQAMADRYTYIPLIGLFIMIAWGGANVFLKWSSNQFPEENRPTAIANTILSVTAISIVALLSVATWFQIQFWSSSITLYKHTLDVAGDSYVVHYNLGNAFLHQEAYDNAADHFRKALGIEANSQKALNNLGFALAKLHRFDEAMNHYSHAMRLDPTFSEPHNNMGNIFALQGKLDRAVVHYLEAIKINSEYKDAHNNLGLALIRQGRVDDAVSHFQKALAISPDFASANRNLNRTLLIKKNLDRAVDAMDQAMNMMKEDLDSKHKLAMLHNKKQALDQAVNNYQKALSIQPGYTKSALNIDNYGKVKRVKQKYRKLLSQ